MPANDPVLPLDTFVTFGDLLKYLRRRARLTQRELSIAVKYSEAQISRLEQNQRPPELSVLVALFIPALYIEDEPEIIARLLELATQARGEVLPASGSITFSRPARREILEDVQTVEEDTLNNLPLQLTSFVGREREATEIMSLLDRENGNARLITLTGSGGAGKTRLALEVAGRLGEKYRDGIWFIELASISDPELLLQAIASTLGTTLAREEAPLRVFVKYLKAKDILLIFDNCEQVLQGMATLAEEILRACPQVQILTTSREIFNIPGEVRFRVPSLALPDEVMADISALSQLESVRLFVERARAIQPSFTITNDNANSIAQICRRVDGMPLGIELAAARMTTLSAQQIASRLEDSFQLLTGGRKSLPRHETLQATIDWSYELLSGEERDLLHSLSVFAGGWTFDAAEAVAEHMNMLDLLSQLVNKSLVVVDFQARGETRYHLPEAIREYSRKRLNESGMQAAVESRHFNFFFDLAEKAEIGFMTHEHQAWLIRLDMERDNLRAALRYGIASKRFEATLQFAGTLFWYWQTLGYISEGRSHLKEIFSSAHELPAGQAVAARAKAYWCAGSLAWIQGETAEADAQLRESIKLWRSLEDAYGLATSLREAGIIAVYSGDMERAHANLHESLNILQNTDKKWDLALTFYNHGLVNESLLNLQLAQTDFEESRWLFQGLNEPWGLSVALFGLGRIAGRQEKYIVAQAHLRESLELARILDDPWSVASILYLLGEVSRLENNLDQAIKHYAESLKLNQTVGDKVMIGFTLHNLGKIAQLHGELDKAARLLGAAKTLRGKSTNTTSWSLTDHAQCELYIVTLQTIFENEAFEQGQAMNIDDAIAYGLTLHS